MTEIEELKEDLEYANSTIDNLEIDKKDCLELLCKLWTSLNKQTEFDKEIYDLLKYEKKLPRYLSPYFIKPL
jgi:hypothetical protein